LAITYGNADSEKNLLDKLPNEVKEVEELFIHSFEEKLTIECAEADISYRKYELASARYPVLRVNHITKWF